MKRMRLRYKAKTIEREAKRVKEKKFIKALFKFMCLYVFFVFSYNLGIVQKGKFNETEVIYILPESGEQVSDVYAAEDETATEDTSEVPELDGEGLSDVVSIVKPDYNFDKVKAYWKTFPGSKIDEDYLNLLAVECGDAKTLAITIAVSVSETSLATNSIRVNNHWGWFKGGNINYDPDRATMATDICNGMRFYESIGGFEGRMDNVRLYTGNDRAVTWYGNYIEALNAMR